MRPKRARNLADKRERLLEAASEIFRRDGFYEARLDDIAELAGVGKGTIYEYFESKENLFEETVLRGMSNYIARIEAEAREPAPLWDQLKVIGGHHVGVFVKSKALIRFTLDSYGVLNETMKLKILAIRDQLVEALTGLLTEAQGRGEFPREVDPRLASLIFIGALNAIGADFLLRTRKELSPEKRRHEVDLAVESVVEVFRRGWR